MSQKSAMYRHKNEGDETRSGKENTKKIPHFYYVTWLIFETLCPVTLVVYWVLPYFIPWAIEGFTLQFKRRVYLIKEEELYPKRDQAPKRYSSNMRLQSLSINYVCMYV